MELSGILQVKRVFPSHEYAVNFLQETCSIKFDVDICFILLKILFLPFEYHSLQTDFQNSDKFVKYLYPL